METNPDLCVFGSKEVFKYLEMGLLKTIYDGSSNSGDYGSSNPEDYEPGNEGAYDGARIRIGKEYQADVKNL